MIIQKDGFPFQFESEACNSCEAQCCSGESGNIFFTKSEMVEIANHLNISTEIFLSDFCRKVGYKYSIKEIRFQGKYNCIFLTENRCDIYNVRPKQCRTFPFWNEFQNKENLEYLKKECIGIFN